MIVKGFSSCCGINIIGISSICLILFASIFGFYLTPMIINSSLKGLNLKPGSDMRKLWEKYYFPVIFKVYIFNITNPMEFVEGKKPHLQEVGPYVFDEWKSKNVLSEDEDEDSVTFEMINTYIFRPDLSNGLTGDEIVNVAHFALMGGLVGAKWDQPGLMQIAIEAFKQIFEPEDSPLLTAKAMDILFNGIEINCDREEAEANAICPLLSLKKGIIQINDTYYTASLFGDKNVTSVGKFKVYRGIKDILKVGDVIAFENRQVSSEYKGQCGKINGTDGTKFAPFHKKMDPFAAFQPILCRSLEFTYTTDSSYNGVPASIYKLEFGDLKNDSSQHCFCRKSDPEKCPPKGTLDNYPCLESPIIISKPHFLDADKKLLTKVDGLNPVRKLHDNNFHFELNTGTPISLRNRIQFSLQIEKIEGFELMSKIEPAIVPIVWVEEKLDLPSELTNIMLYGIYLFQNVVAVFKYSGIFLGLCGLFYVAYKKYDNMIAEKSVQTVEYSASGEQ